MSVLFDHPVIRYSRYVLCALAAAVTVFISASINPHSVAWLLAIYVTLGVLIGGLRRFREGPVYRAFVLYLTMLLFYLMTVWLLHTEIPGRSPAAALAAIRGWILFFRFGPDLTATAQLNFAIYFTRSRSRVLKYVNVISWAICIIPLYHTYIDQSTQNYIWTGRTWVPAMDSAYKMLFYVVSTQLTLALLIPLARMFTTRDRDVRLQMFFYTLGATPTWIACWGNFLISLGINIYPAGGFMFLFHAALLAYAVLQYRAFDVTVRVRRGLAYAMCCVILGAVYAVTSLLLIQAGQQTAVSLAIRVGILLVLVFLYAPLLGRLQHRLDAFFFRTSVDREQVLERFAQETAAVLDLTRVAHSLCGALNAGLKPRRVDFYLKPSNQEQFALYGAFESEFAVQQWPSDQMLPAAVAARVAQETAAFPTKVAALSQDRVVQFATGDDALAVPVVHGNERLACILIGPKTADEAFTAEDIRFAETLAASSSSVLQNARSYLQIERLQKLTTSILNSLSTGVLLLSQDGGILTANTAARSICGTGEACPGKLNALWETQPALAGAIRRALKEHDLRSNDELQLDGANAACVLFSINALNVEDPHGMYVAMLHDITDYKKMQSLAEQRANLAHIGEAAATINHEIKNLLHPVRRQMDRLTRVDANDPAAIQQELARATEVIPERLTMLERMLRNLNLLGRPLALRPQKFELESMARAVWNEIQARQSGAKPEFALTIGSGAETVVADANSIRLVLYNLLLNAAEAASGGSGSEVQLIAELNGGVYTLNVRDNGRGIDPKDHARIFEPFFSTKGEAGAGLGLSLCRKIVEAHGGRIAIVSENGATNVESTWPQPALLSSIPA